MTNAATTVCSHHHQLEGVLSAEATANIVGQDVYEETVHQDTCLQQERSQCVQRAVIYWFTERREHSHAIHGQGPHARRQHSSGTVQALKHLPVVLLLDQGGYPKDVYMSPLETWNSTVKKKGTIASVAFHDRHFAANNQDQGHVMTGVDGEHQGLYTIVEQSGDDLTVVHQKQLLRHDGLRQKLGPLVSGLDDALLLLRRLRRAGGLTDSMRPLVLSYFTNLC